MSQRHNMGFLRLCKVKERQGKRYVGAAWAKSMLRPHLSGMPNQEVRLASVDGADPSRLYVLGRHLHAQD